MKKIIAVLSLLICSLFASPAAAQPLPFATLTEAQALAENVVPFGCPPQDERPGLAAALAGEIAVFLLANGDGTADVLIAQLRGGAPVYVWEAKADAEGRLKVVRHGKYNPALHGENPCFVMVKPQA